MTDLTTQLADQLDWHWREQLRPRLDGLTDDGWITGVRSLPAADLTRRCGPAEGPYADYLRSELVLHINREAIHHGAEIACLRDLYAHRQTVNQED
ncbi:hypothetical protein BN1232_01085 [Mycobacterium lentiflavum]|uniref:DinB superfamily protein n=1 Tax=Mycobacterium lentiflavum TaxID=141349 RepID=A0A0E4GVU0_MYCLN|nr:hypothetical protein [Mycobacterium lentiflavum]CQD06294.1 hypothetical protein BN1232_01085 [Mycobacterium lentiflavum]